MEAQLDSEAAGLFALPGKHPVNIAPSHRQELDSELLYACRDDEMKKVLIVDDEPDIVDLVSMILDDEDVTLLTAYDGHEALEIVRQEHPDLVITDIMMPRLDGRELCMRVRSEPATSDTVVVLMSAMQNLDPNGCDAAALIHKPFDIDEMEGTVDRLLGREN